MGDTRCAAGGAAVRAEKAKAQQNQTAALKTAALRIMVHWLRSRWQEHGAFFHSRSYNTRRARLGCSLRYAMRAGPAGTSCAGGASKFTVVQAIEAAASLGGQRRCTRAASRASASRAGS